MLRLGRRPDSAADVGAAGTEHVELLGIDRGQRHRHVLGLLDATLRGDHDRVEGLGVGRLRGGLLGGLGGRRGVLRERDMRRQQQGDGEGQGVTGKLAGGLRHERRLDGRRPPWRHAGIRPGRRHVHWHAGSAIQRLRPSPDGLGADRPAPQSLTWRANVTTLLNPPYPAACWLSASRVRCLAFRASGRGAMPGSTGRGRNRRARRSTRGARRRHAPSPPCLLRPVISPRPPSAPW